jgi:hypothetical protein
MKGDGIVFVVCGFIVCDSDECMIPRNIYQRSSLAAK